MYCVSYGEKLLGDEIWQSSVLYTMDLLYHADLAMIGQGAGYRSPSIFA